MLLSVLSSIAVREMDVPISQKLSIFSMNMKLGVSFASTAVLFGLHRTTVSRIFYFVLTNLLHAMKKWIPEPPLRTVQATMPSCFKTHYLRCCYIIVCTELRTEEPPTIEQKRALFSHYKGGYTLKFLAKRNSHLYIAVVWWPHLRHSPYAGIRVSRTCRARRRCFSGQGFPWNQSTC